jgi:hypothetical protein
MKLCALLVSILGLAAPASAGVVDSPLPMIPGIGKLKHVYTITGVSDGGDLGTAFICTNLDSKSVFVGVEIFAAGGGTPMNDVTMDDGTALASPGQTVTIELEQIVSFFETDLINETNQVAHGSARIVATSTKLLCTAALVEKFTEPAVSMLPLPVIRKTQKGD